jgi:hypothetical protein
MTLIQELNKMNFIKQPWVIATALIFSLNSYAAVKETFTLSNTTDKYLIIQETLSRQIASSGHKYTVNPNSSKSWVITINPLSNINEWFYEFTISAASNMAATDALLFSVVNHDIEGVWFPFATDQPYGVSCHNFTEADDGSLFVNLNVSN